MILTVVGCAGTVPGPDAACSCYLLEHAGVRILLDLGTGALGPLQRWADPCAVDAVVLSHPHRDHCADLVPLAYLRDRRGASGTLPVLAPAGSAGSVVGDGRPYTGALRWIDTRPEPYRIGPFTVRTVPVVHSVPAVAVQVSAGGASLTYSGDTGACPELDALARGTDVLLCEAAAAVDTPGSTRHHLTPAQAAETATRAGAGQLILTHLRPWADPVAALAEARAHCSGPVSLAVPGLRVAV
ncbi:MBL fold metallo-hydrolase [Spirillospora sp. NPDC049652]